VTVFPDEVLANIPGWEGADYEELQGGLSNKTWLVVADGRKGVLKIDNEPRGAPLNTRCDEAFVQNAAAKVGLAAKVILANDSLFFSEYVEGTVWTRSCLDKGGNLELLAAALKRLHSLPLTGRSFDASIAARKYVDRVASLDQSVVEKCMQIVARMRLPQNLCCCHNDLVAENLITTPDLKFLDWEYACDNDPFFDLATIVEHHELVDEQVVTLLDAYFDGDSRRWRGHLENQRTLYLALLCLWMASRPENDAEELQKIVTRLITRNS